MLFRSLANGAIVNTGVAAPLTFTSITLAAGAPSGSYGNLAAEMTTGGAVETVLRIASGNATVLAYQVDAGTGAAGDLGACLSVIVERSGWTSNAALQTYIRSLGNPSDAGNIGATTAVTVTNALVFDRGLKLSRQ